MLCLHLLLGHKDMHLLRNHGFASRKNWSLFCSQRLQPDSALTAFPTLIDHYPDQMLRRFLYNLGYAYISRHEIKNQERKL